MKVAEKPILYREQNTMKNRWFELLAESYEAEIESAWKPIPEMLDNPIKEEEFEKLKECAKDNETQIPNLLLYLSRIFNVQQVCDFYWIVYNLQIEYGAFMTNEDNLAFGKVYNKALEELKKRRITFGAYKETICSELNKRAQPENVEVLIFIAMSLLLNKDKNLIYNVLEQDVISAQVDAGDYYPF